MSLGNLVTKNTCLRWKVKLEIVQQHERRGLRDGNYSSSKPGSSTTEATGSHINKLRYINLLRSSGKERKRKMQHVGLKELVSEAEPIKQSHKKLHLILSSLHFRSATQGLTSSPYMWLAHLKLKSRTTERMSSTDKLVQGRKMVSIFYPAPIASVIGMDAKINFLLPGPLWSQFVPIPILQYA